MRLDGVEDDGVLALPGEGDDTVVAAALFAGVDTAA